MHPAVPFDGRFMWTPTWPASRTLPACLRSERESPQSCEDRASAKSTSSAGTNQQWPIVRVLAVNRISIAAPRGAPRSLRRVQGSSNHQRPPCDPSPGGPQAAWTAPVVRGTGASQNTIGTQAGWSPRPGALPLQWTLAAKWVSALQAL